MPIKTINANTLKNWLDKNEAVLIDVREADEYKSECIAAATLIPLATINRQALPDITGKKLVMQCRSGHRSGMACEYLLSTDPTLEIYNLEGGILAWAQAGYEIKTAGKFSTT